MSPSPPPTGDRPIKTLDRVLSKAGLGSRSEARAWIARGRVAVNGETVTDPDTWIDLERDRVAFDGRALQQEARRYLMLHKPAGYLTTYRHPRGRPTVFDLLPDGVGYLFPVGRLDLETTGLLLLTNDSQFAEFVTNPQKKVAKTYRVVSDEPLSEAQLEALRGGVELADGPVRPAVVEPLAEPKTFLLTITEGRNRQVRRMLEAVGRRVIDLSRIAIGPLRLGELETGAVRELTAREIEQLGYSADEEIERGKTNLHDDRTRRETKTIFHQRRRR